MKLRLGALLVFCTALLTAAANAAPAPEGSTPIVAPPTPLGFPEPASSPSPQPTLNAALVYTATGNLSAKLIAPAEGGAASDLAAIFDIRTGAGGGVALAVNGEAVSERQIGKRADDPKTGTTDWFFYGVHLRAGPNDVTMVPLGAGKLTGTPVHAIVYGPGEPVSVRVAIDHQPAANGRDSATLSVVVTDRWQHPVAPHGKLRATILSGAVTFAPSASPPPLAATTVNSAIQQDKTASQITAHDRVIEIGVNGTAVVPIVSGLQAGDVVIRFVTANGVESSFRFFERPDARRPLVAGILTGGIGSVPGLPGLATTATDGSDSRQARAAFFFKGAVAPGTLLSAAYETANRLSDGSSQLGPYISDPLDRPYETYGDNSVRDTNALSYARLYARLEHGHSSAMYGTYTVDTAPLQGVSAGGYHADLSGVKLQAGGSATTVTAFNANNQFAFARVDFNPLGLGTAPLGLHPDIVVGSEQVLLVTRDRRTGAIIATVPLVANVDYLIDDTSGLIRFINIPLPYDLNFNPQTIVVTYQYQGASVAGASTTGFKFSQRFGNSVYFNAGYANDATGSGNYTISNQDLRAVLKGGELSISHALSSGQAQNVDILNGTQTPGVGGALIFDYHQKIGPNTFIAQYSNTGQGFSSPFGGLGSPGLRQYHVGAARDFGHGSTLDVSTEAESVTLDGSSSAGSSTSIHYNRALSRTLLVRVGLAHVTQNDSVAASTASPSPDGSSAPTATSSVQLDTAVAWKPTKRLDFLVDRITPLTGESGSLYPGQTLVEAGLTMPGNGRAFVRQQWTDTPSSSLYSQVAGSGSGAQSAPPPASGVTQFANTGGTTSSTEIGFSRPLGAATTYESGLVMDNGTSGRNAYWGNQVTERFVFGKGLSGDASVQVANPLSASGNNIGFAVYGMDFAYTNKNNFKFALSAQQRNGSGNGSTITLGATGPIAPGWNILGTSTTGNTSGFSNRDTKLGLSWRPVNDDRGVTLFEYDNYSGTLVSAGSQTNVAAIEQVYRPMNRLELAGRIAYKIDGGGGYYTAHTAFYGVRATEKMSGALSRFDIGAEFSGLDSPGIGQTQTTAFATEIGFRAIDSTRLAFGYNFSGSADPTLTNAPTRRGFYFTATSVVDRIFGWGKR